MSHEIENNMIAWKGEEPWHGLGTQVPANATGAEMLVAAKLNWRVQRRDLAMKDAKGHVIKDTLSAFKAITRSDNNVVFSVTSDKYQTVQNAEIVDLFQEYCDAGHASMETVGGLRNGAVVWALAKLTPDADAVLVGDDKLKGYVLLSTSHDGTLATTGKATSVRVVCNNTLTAALHGRADFALRHTAKWTAERKAEAKRALGVAVANVQQLNTAAAQLAKVRIDEHDWQNFMSEVLGGTDKVIDPETKRYTRLADAIREATLLSPGAEYLSAKGTLWGAVNGVSYFTDHQRGRTQDNRLASAWFGPSDLLKRKAVSKALEMAGVETDKIHVPA